MQDMKTQDTKLADQTAGHEKAGAKFVRIAVDSESLWREQWRNSRTKKWKFFFKKTWNELSNRRQEIYIWIYEMHRDQTQSIEI